MKTLREQMNESIEGFIKEQEDLAKQLVLMGEALRVAKGCEERARGFLDAIDTALAHPALTDGLDAGQDGNPVSGVYEIRVTTNNAGQIPILFRAGHGVATRLIETFDFPLSSVGEPFAEKAVEQMQHWDFFVVRTFGAPKGYGSIMPWRQGPDSETVYLLVNCAQRFDDIVEAIERAIKNPPELVESVGFEPVHHG